MSDLLKNKKPLLILGTGAMALEAQEMAEDLLDYDVAGFVVNEPPYTSNSKLNKIPIYWIDEIESMNQEFVVISALARMKKSAIIDQATEFGFDFCNLIHPSACLSKSVQLGSGIIIKGGVQIGPNTRIGNHVVVGRGTLIGGNSIIQECSFLSSGVILAGRTTIGACSFIGLGSMVLDYKSIGHHSIVGAGSLVTKDIPDRVKAIGSPAMVIKKDIDGFL